MKKPSGDLRTLILLCSENIKGLSRKSDIEKLLPINNDGFSIQALQNKIEIKYKNELLGNIWLDTNCYSNLEILKTITPIYNVDYKGEGILELLKYKNKITLILL